MTSRDSPETWKQRRERAVQLVRAGATPQEIGKELGIGTRSVHTLLYRMSRDGLIPGPAVRLNDKTLRQPGHWFRYNAGIRTGHMHDILKHLTVAELDWLREETVEGAILADTIAAVIKDAAAAEAGEQLKTRPVGKRVLTWKA